MTVDLPQAGENVGIDGAGSREEAFLRAQQVLLEHTAAGKPLRTVLEGIVRLVEAQSSEMLCSILLLDRARGVVRHGAAPNLPESFSRAIDGAPIGPTAGSCGTAAFRGEVVEVEDIATHPYWESYRDLALPLGLRACWSTPIMSPEREVLGTFAMYYHVPRLPTFDERRWVQAATHLAGIAIQSSRARESEVALVRSEAELRALFDHAAIGIALVGPDGHFVRVNPTLCRILGYEPAEMLTLTPTGITHPEDLASDLALAQELISGARESYQIEKRYMRKDGSILWGRFTASLVKSAAHSERMLGIGMIEDIGAQKRLEAQLLRSQRLDGLSRLAGGLAHDFNNVLTAIQGSARLALDELPAGKPHPARDAIGDIELATARATELVHRILAFSPDAEPQRTVQPLAPIVREVLRLLAANLPSRVVLQDVLSDEPLLVKADATQIHQLLMNLATNGTQAMPEGGTLTIRLGPRALTTRDGPIAAGHWAYLAVTDGGTGIEESLLEQVFEPFFTTKPPGQGTGLGLAIVQAIVHGHEGVVRLRTQVGKGSTFEVWLPAIESVEHVSTRTPSGATWAESTSAAPRALKPTLLGRGEHVLFVDDEPIIGRLAKRELENAGYKVSMFDDAVLALEAFKAAPHTFDAVVTDASMPRLSGFDVAREVRTLRPTIPIVVISGGLWNRESHELQSLGIGELLLKPQALRDMASALRRHLDAQADGGLSDGTATS